MNSFVAALIVGAGVGAATPITLEQLDARTANHSRRIAQLELDVSTLEKQLRDLKAAPKRPSPPAPAQGTTAAPRGAQTAAQGVPVHTSTEFSFRFTEFKPFDKSDLLEKAAELEDQAQTFRFPKEDTKESERRANVRRAVELEREARQIRKLAEVEQIVLMGPDASGRTVLCTMPPGLTDQARAIPLGTVMTVLGELVHASKDSIQVNAKRILNP